MLFASPEPEAGELEVVARIGEIRAQVRLQAGDPKQWPAVIAPLFLGSSATASSGGEEPAATAGDDAALAGYGQAMKYVLHVHDDPHFVYDEGFVRALHFMMLSHDARQNPGRWRAAPICVKRTSTNEVLYEAPPAEVVPERMRELMARLNEKDEAPALFRAAMAHLNLVKIHPFSDGNGRMGRALHALVLVREGVLDPEFCSIEHYVASARYEYFETLADVGYATWSPAEDARPFLRFCLAAHLHQAECVLDQAHRMARVWAEAEREIEQRRLPSRLIAALAEAASFGEVGDAGRDLKTLVEHGILATARRRRDRSATAGPLAQAIRDRAWTAYPPRSPSDPFVKGQVTYHSPTSR